MTTIGRALRTLAIASLVLIAGAVAVLFFGSERRLNKKYDGRVARVRRASDSISVARGEHLYQSISCALCHGIDAGGAVLQDDVIGTFAGPNLTSGRGGVAAIHSDSDWVRAIRRGVRPDGTSLILMPSEVFTHLSETDLASILGYLRTLQPVDREIPATSFGPLGRALLAAGKMNLLVASKTPRYAAPETAPPERTKEYGRYLADVSGCHGCHGYGLSGGRVAGPPDLPPASNLTPSGIGKWSEGDLVRALRAGTRPDGSAIDEFMPWKTYRNMSDDDLHALWLYLVTVPRKDFGNK